MVVDMNYKEVNMMKNLLELHTIKSNPIVPAEAEISEEVIEFNKDKSVEKKPK